MNLFYLDHDPVLAARWHVDKHIVKMPLESCQMLSTAHRLLDGDLVTVIDPRKRKFQVLKGETVEFSGDRYVIKDQKCYLVSHANHPTTRWTMASRENFEFHVQFLLELLDEYKRRYGRTYKSAETVLPFLKFPPKNLKSNGFTLPPPAMPDHYKVADVVESYRNYYAGSKWRFAKWKHGDVPPWFLDRVRKVWALGDPAQRAADASKFLSKKKSPAAESVTTLVRNLNELYGTTEAIGALSKTFKASAVL